MRAPGLPSRVRARALIAATLCFGAACLGEPPAVGGAGTDPVVDDRPLVLPPLVPCEPSLVASEPVRVATWNMSAGRIGGLEGVEQQLRAIDADVVVLQEVDVGVRRTGSVDQPRLLGEALDMQYAFAAALPFDGGDFGMAVLTRLPMSRAERISLSFEAGYEERILFDVSVCVGEQPLRLVDVHADFVTEANASNLRELGEHLGSTVELPVIMAGDFNATPDSAGVVGLLQKTEAVDAFATLDPGPTRNGERIDFMLISPALWPTVVDGERVQTEASDHTPLWVDLALR